MPNVRWLIALITVVHRFLYRVTGGWIGSRAPGIRMLLLENIGRRSGQRRVTPLLYVEDGEDFVVVASNGGDDRAPAWWYNVRENPDVAVQIGRQRIPVRARSAGAHEEDSLWQKLESSYRYYEDYRARAQREIPIVVLERIAAPDASAQSG